jgi:hypothetical protein
VYQFSPSILAYPTSAQIPADGVPHLLTFVITSSTITCFIDGASEAMTVVANGTPNSGYHFCLGGFGSGSAAYYTGLCADWEIYAGAFNSTDVAGQHAWAHANLGTP